MHVMKVIRMRGPLVSAIMCLIEKKIYDYRRNWKQIMIFIANFNDYRSFLRLPLIRFSGIHR